MPGSLAGLAIPAFSFVARSKQTGHRHWHSYRVAFVMFHSTCWVAAEVLCGPTRHCGDGGWLSAFKFDNRRTCSKRAFSAAPSSELIKEESMSLPHPSVTSEQRYTSLAFVFLSFVMFLGTIYLTFDAWKLSQGSVATGKIVALDSKNRPTVHFLTHNGEHITFQDGTSSPFLIYAVGNDVEVAFRADDPQEAQIAGHQWGFPILLAILALACSGFGIAGLKGRAIAGPLRGRRAGIGVD